MTPAFVLLATLGLVMPQVAADQRPATGTISVEPGVDRDEAPDPVFDAAVERALGNAGFVPLQDRGHSRFVARVRITRSDRGAVRVAARKSRPSTSVGNWGAGVQVELPSRKSELGALVLTRLTVTILRRRDSQAIWQGSALTAQPDDASGGGASTVAQKLADTLIAQYPARLPGPISVP